MVPVVKKNEKIRICRDLKKLLEAINRKNCMLPNMDVLPKLADANIFYIFD